ncbi:MAG: hypothetical protein RIC14_07785 [Filomicrobium sp.]
MTNIKDPRLIKSGTANTYSSDDALLSGAETRGSQVRLQLELSKEASDEMSNLMNRCGLATRKDLINNALVLLRWAVDEVEKGGSISSVDPINKSYTEIKTPALDYASRRSVQS